MEFRVLGKSAGRRVAGVACLLIAFQCAAGAADGTAGRERSGPVVDSTARLIAGLAPSSPEHQKAAGSKAWQDHSQAIGASWAQVRERQLQKIAGWRTTELPRDCGAGGTLLYPFSGPDFVNAYSFFPGCSTYVLFGLERLGDLPDVASMSEAQFVQYLAALRRFMINLFVRNYFVTGTMAKDIRADQLSGVVPVLAASMALSGLEVTRVAPLALPDAERAPKGGRGAPDFKAVAIDFRAPGSTRTQRVVYFSADATNAGLAMYPQFTAYLKALGNTVTLIKSASYLLHWNQFSAMRDLLFEKTALLVQDDTGLPYALLAERKW